MANVTILKTDGKYNHIEMDGSKDEVELKIFNEINVDRYGVGFITLRGKEETLILDVKNVDSILIK